MWFRFSFLPFFGYSIYGTSISSIIDDTLHMYAL